MVNTTIAHFEALLKKHGNTFEALDWHRGGQESQFRHFSRLLALDPMMQYLGRSILDVGCGFGDLLGYMNDYDNHSFEYTGYDIVPGMITHARVKYPDGHFETQDILELPNDTSLRFDYVFASGVIVWLPEGDWGTFIQFVKRMFLLCNVGVAFNMYSTHVPEIVPGRFYADPWDVMMQCWYNVTKRIKIDHGYMPETYVVYLYR